MWFTSSLVLYVLSYLGFLPSWSNLWFDWLCWPLFSLPSYSICVCMAPHSDALDIDLLLTNKLTMPFLAIFSFLPFCLSFLWLGSVSGSYEKLWFHTTGCTHESSVNDTGHVHPVMLWRCTLTEHEATFCFTQICVFVRHKHPKD